MGLNLDALGLDFNIPLPVVGQIPASGITPTETKAPPSTDKQMRRMTFSEWEKEVTAWIEDVDKNVYAQLHRKWREMFHFYEGNQLIYWDDQANDYIGVELEDGDPYYPSNIFQPAINGILAELYQSNPELVVQAKTDNWKQVDAASQLRRVLINEERRELTPDFTLRSLWFFVLYGNLLWHTTWVAGIGPEMDMPQVGVQDMQADSRINICPNCDYRGLSTAPTSPPPGMPPNAGQAPIPTYSDASANGLDPDMGLEPLETGNPAEEAEDSAIAQSQQDMFAQAAPEACPECGGPMIQDGGMETAQIPQFTEPEKMRDGDVQTRIPDPTCIKVDLSGRNLSDIGFLREDSYMHANTARALYKKARPQAEGGSRSQEDRRDIRRMESSIGDTNGLGSLGEAYKFSEWTTQDKYITCIKRYWIRTEYYYDVVLTEDAQFDKFNIPAETRMIDVFAKGIYLAKQDDIVLDVDKRLIEKEWTHAKYSTIPGKFWGNGPDSIIAGQREYNEYRSIELENGFHNATPSTVINPRKIKAVEVSGKARKILTMENPRSEDNPGDYIYTPPTRALGGELPAMRMDIKGDMQLITTVPIGSNGLEGGGGNTTATGQQIQRDYMNTRLNLRIAPVIEARLARAEQHLELMQKYWVAPRFISYVGDNGINDALWIESHDIEGEFDLSVKDGSWQPRSAMEQKDNILQLLVAGGMPGGVFNPSFPQYPARILMNTLGFGSDFDEHSMHVRKQRDEIDSIKQTLQVAQQMAMMNPMAMGAPAPPPGMPGEMPPQEQSPVPLPNAQGQGQEQGMMLPMPPDPITQTLIAVPVEETDDHQIHIDTIKHYLNTDIGRKETPDVKAAIIEHMHGHQQAQMMEMQQEAMKQAMMGGFPGSPGAPGGGQQQGQMDSKSQPPNSGGKKPPSKDKG